MDLPEIQRYVNNLDTKTLRNMVSSLIFFHSNGEARQVYENLNFALEQTDEFNKQYPVQNAESQKS